ncbi:hypothetical protein PtrSN002B_011512 [Pyrenophora tritici-repentis]|uniref:Uncharacterized protein n=1 Tax=Pyrenophora tritici-repentis TaxID=45151 RepID=A0A2W1FMJ2_9PLEO|nr:hypothetical protein PtrV1_05926 [Pyrenophora tritici-repentis]KAF7450656.1 hypothetical protein A1F99_052720 [Pyrenophora tritici-repentis]KAF7573276.1 hypothetical protein PtrM4_081810 [Pyrenophora tritici-repentis]KAG9381128.1 hypothetical protein A1F94_008448 [Pyrenophora tritici-repentis]KAI0569318.1 hypothetical protein Alg215_11709 [Pyrenophora tritici-repentis]
MVVVCEALIHHHQAGKPIRVKNIFHRTGWRFMLYIRGIHQFVIAITRISPFYFVWRIIWGVSSFVRHQDFDIKDFYDNSPFRNTISRTWINLLCKDGTSGWSFFWYLYFFCAENQADFMNDYREA